MLAPRQFGRSSEPEESEAPKTGVKAATALLEPTCFGCLLLKWSVSFRYTHSITFRYVHATGVDIESDMRLKAIEQLSQSINKLVISNLIKCIL